MPLWCEAIDVAELLDGMQGNNFDASHFPSRIDKARDLIITELAGKFPKATLDEWDADVSAVPPTIRMVCANIAAALILQVFVQDNSLGDQTSKAGGFYKFAMDRIKSIKADTSTVATGADDNTSVASASGIVASTKTASDRIFTKTSMENL